MIFVSRQMRDKRPVNLDSNENQWTERFLNEHSAHNGVSRAY